MNRAELGSALRALRQASGKEAKAEYMSVARAAATEATAWRLYRRLGHHRKQRQIQEIEARTKVLRLFQPALVPGLLQTPEYVRAVLSRRDPGEEKLARSVAVRLARQGILYEPGRQLRFIVTESVLRWRIVSPLVSRLPSVDLRLVPLSARQTDFPSHSFSIKGDRMVTVETVHAELSVTDPRDVALYIEKFDGFERVAVSGDPMRGSLETIRDEFLREQKTE